MSNGAKPKSRLGRGLSSLMSMSELPVDGAIDEGSVGGDSAANVAVPVVAQTPVTGLPIELPIGSIAANPHQPRKQLTEAALLSLAASIRSTGLIQPVVVRPAADGTAGAYELVAGERRLRRPKLRAWRPFRRSSAQVDAFKQAQMALIENVQREDLNPVDRAQAYRTLMDQLGLTQAELATRIGEDRSSIAIISACLIWGSRCGI